LSHASLPTNAPCSINASRMSLLRTGINRSRPQGVSFVSDKAAPRTSAERDDRQHQMARMLLVVIDAVHHGLAAADMIRSIFDVMRAGEPARQIEAGDVEADAVTGLEQIAGR
jgi:hypothetical protein